MPRQSSTNHVKPSHATDAKVPSRNALQICPASGPVHVRPAASFVPESVTEVWLPCSEPRKVFHASQSAPLAARLPVKSRVNVMSSLTHAPSQPSPGDTPPSSHSSLPT